MALKENEAGLNTLYPKEKFQLFIETIITFTLNRFKDLLATEINKIISQVQEPALKVAGGIQSSSLIGLLQVHYSSTQKTCMLHKARQGIENQISALTLSIVELVDYLQSAKENVPVKKLYLTYVIVCLILHTNYTEESISLY